MDTFLTDHQILDNQKIMFDEKDEDGNWPRYFTSPFSFLFLLTTPHHPLPPAKSLNPLQGEVITARAGVMGVVIVVMGVVIVVMGVVIAVMGVAMVFFLSFFLGRRVSGFGVFLFFFSFFFASFNLHNNH